LALGVCECTACLACACCQKALNGVLAGAARFGHVLVIATIFTLAGILGTQYPDNVSNYKDYTEVDLKSGCSAEYEDTCIYRQLMYRASFALFIMFCLLAVGTMYSEPLNRSMWPFKFGVSCALFVGFWWGKNEFFDGWAEFTRAMSFVWLMFQGLLLIDFGHDCHDAIMAQAEEKEKEEEGGGRPWLVLYVVLSLGFLSMTGTGLAYLFMNYSGCSLGMFLIIVTLIFGVLTTVLSLLNVVNKGFLTPCIMFSYSTFMCWYALLSSPSESCNPTAMDNTGSQWRVSIGVLIAVSFVILLYIVANGTVILNIFNPEGQGVMTSYNAPASSTLTTSLAPKEEGTAAEATGLNTEKASPEIDRSRGASGDAASTETSGSTHERVFFHVLMIFFIIYATMMLTNWGKTNGNVQGAGDPAVANESLWFKVISQWAFIGMYLRVLQVAYQDNQ
jgi:hypothetical protein